MDPTLLRAAFGSLSVSCRSRRPAPCSAPRALGASGRANASWVMAQVEVRLLGPFELATAEGPQRLPGHGERALLAALALSAGRAVAMPTLIEALWDPDHQPDDPVNALQVRVSKLRRALAAVGAGDVVDRQGPGTGSGSTRADRRPCLPGLIETARRTGDPRQAVELYDECLVLWRASRSWTSWGPLGGGGDRPADRAAARGDRRAGRTDADAGPVRGVGRGPGAGGCRGADPGAAGRAADDRAVQRRAAGRRVGGVRPDPAGVGRRAGSGPVPGAART